MQALPEKVTIVEVGPRDGLQFEPSTLNIKDKLAFIEQLADCGLTHIEAGSFVSPGKIPQLADSDDVFRRLKPREGVIYSALVPNEKGMERALKVKVSAIALFTAASETFCRKNIGCSIDESFARFDPVIQMAKHNNVKVRGYISCVLGCPYEGNISAQKVTAIAKRLYDAGCDEISLGDTIGSGTPLRAQALISQTTGAVPVNQLAVHFHDTRGQALANILASLQMGISIVDASVAGLGGCPYAEGATGNVATEDVVYMLDGLGITTGIDIDCLIKTGNDISTKLQRRNNSRVGNAGVPHWQYRETTS
ncbi:MAG: hydroxymethylglutaryl-CoA lyase [Gammaproteobacteria bacterium]|jgi:hydroxymethylglutaryl-CoA lyase